MNLGRRIWQFKELRLGALISVAVGLLAAAWASGGITLFPPGLKEREAEIASASTQVVVDTPRSAILDVRQDSYAIQSLTDRSVLLGNLVASPPVREYIAEQASIPVDSLLVAAPLTPDQPRARAALGANRGPGELVRSNADYRLAIRANPTVPVLALYAQAPTVETAEKITNAAVEGLRQYLDRVAVAQDTAPGDQIRLLQLGPASPSGVINPGVRWQLGVVAFILAFGLSCAGFVLLRRIREGYRMARAEHGLAASP
jgi:hypothetical protein